MPQTLKIAIPMAGYGSRMRPHTWSKPKPLLPLAGKTVLDHCLNQFSTLPVVFEPEFIFIVSPFQVEQVTAYLKQNYPDLPWQMVVQEVMRGQSDALLLARQHLHGPMLMCFSDTLTDASFKGLDSEPLDGIAWVKPVPDPRRFGVAEINQQGRVTRFVEKPQSLDNNRVVVGFYYFRSSEALMSAIEEQMRRNISLRGEFFLTDAINILLEGGASMRTQEVGVWLDAGIPDAVLETNRYLLEHGQDNSTETAARFPNALIRPPVFVHPSAVLEGAVIGPHAAIGANCTLRQCVISNSILDDGTKVENLVLEGSLLGKRVGASGHASQLNLGDDAWIKM
jgi:glucose-1-phosphate thymidylyltransferase